MTDDAGEAQRAVFNARVAEIQAMPPAAAFEAASALVALHSAYRGRAADVRALMARRVYDSQPGMTLADLGARLGVTKQRAEKLLRRAAQLT